MDDIASRLRNAAAIKPPTTGSAVPEADVTGIVNLFRRMILDAADEIARLRKELAKAEARVNAVRPSDG